MPTSRSRSLTDPSNEEAFIDASANANIDYPHRWRGTITHSALVALRLAGLDADWSAEEHIDLEEARLVEGDELLVTGMAERKTRELDAGEGGYRGGGRVTSLQLFGGPTPESELLVRRAGESAPNPRGRRAVGIAAIVVGVALIVSPIVGHF